MSERKPISKSLRFEVLKRDHFTCQYCGAKAPDFIMEIDHIVPVAEGGTNDILNLITSCRDCNRGKGKRKLETNVAMQSKSKALEDLAIKKEQLEMMVEWEKELQELVEYQIDYIDSKICLDGYRLSENGRAKVKSLIKKFDFNLVVKASDIMVNNYVLTNRGSWDSAFHKLGGICYNLKKKQEEGEED